MGLVVLCGFQPGTCPTDSGHGGLSIAAIPAAALSAASSCAVRAATADASLPNPAEAIATAAPTGVDVSSGVCSPDGLKKDLGKVQRYCAAAAAEFGRSASGKQTAGEP